MSQLGSIFYENLKNMLRENNKNFVMTRPYGYKRFAYIQQLRITRIKLVANYERLFRQFLHDTISHITTDYDFSFGAFDYRRRNPVDTVGYLICQFNEDNFKCLKAVDGVECMGKFLAIQEIKLNRESDQAKLNETNRLRRTVQYGPMTYYTIPEMVIDKKSSEKATQTRDLIHKSTSF